jgi:hypothetical protein
VGVAGRVGMVVVCTSVNVVSTAVDGTAAGASVVVVD